MTRTGHSADLTELLRACLVVLRVLPGACRSTPASATGLLKGCRCGGSRDAGGIHPDGAAFENLTPSIAADAPAGHLRIGAAMVSTLVASL